MVVHKETAMHRYLARWEKLVCDWESVLKEVSTCPFLKEVKRLPERIVLELYFDGNILDYPSMGGGIANNDYSLIEEINKYKRENGVPSLPANTHVSWGSHSHFGNRHNYWAYITIWADAYCDHTKRVWFIERNDLIPTVSKTHCWFWQHDWEIHKDFVRSDGYHTGWFSSGGIQKAIFKCKHCGKEKLKYRSGVIGLFEGGSTGWEKCSEAQEERIDASPLL